ncbi:MAG: hypothetical protein IPJ84_01115 [Bdellovibrionales bacterium]|nr:hypothetical protein [Bdellovibrionales bacterium]
MARHESWTRCALALFFNRATDSDVCTFWSNAADRHILEAARLSRLTELGVAVFALGKLGAQELNLSSDIDIVFVSEDRGNEQLKAAREFIRLLSQVDEWGFCHRVDVDLRPGGSGAPLLVSPTEFENHYGYHGETWERLALVRLRAVCGSDSITGEVTTFARTFSFRRHLDYTVFEELQLLLTRIRNEYPPRAKDAFNLKLQAGGIRDIELLTHALQVIHGGRNQSLRTRSTTEAINKLAAAGLLNTVESQLLNQTYWRYRAIENRLQAYGDQQTYLVTDPITVAEVSALATQVVRVSEASFPKIETAPELSPEKLVEMGFTHEVAIHALDELEKSQALSKKSERDEKERRQFLSNFISCLQKKSADRDLALQQLVDFTKSIRAKASLFSLLNREPILLNQIATLFGVSPWAGQTLSSRPELLDAFLLRQDSAPVQSIEHDIAYENLSERRLLGELLAVLHFLEDKNLDPYSANLTSLADSITQDVMQLVTSEVGGEPLSLFALGKWGGRELGVRSDLDFVLVSRTTPTDSQHKIARRFLNRLTEAHRGGSIYSVDMRLRPSGKAGPILISRDALFEHLTTKAEAWERQSWLRARCLPPLSLDLSPQTIVLDRPWTTTDEAQVSDIANQLFKPVSAQQKEIDLKLSHGGLAPIEFAIQAALLRNGPWPRASLDTSTSGMLHFLEGHREQWRMHGENLSRCYQHLRKVEQALRIAGDRSGSRLPLVGSEVHRIARMMGVESETLVQELIATLEESTAILSRLKEGS